MTECMIDRPKSTEAGRSERASTCRCYRPDVDIVETADELTVSADLPGVKAEDVDINFDNGTMTIVGKAPNRRPEGTTPVLTEYGVGDFHRSFEVSEKIQADKISAEFAHGVLTLHLPKGEAIKPRKIALQTK